MTDHPKSFSPYEVDFLKRKVGRVLHGLFFLCAFYYPGIIIIIYIIRPQFFGACHTP